MPVDWLKIGLNLDQKIVTIFENTTGKLIRKSDSPHKNCCNLVVKDGYRLDLVGKLGVDAIC